MGGTPFTGEWKGQAHNKPGRLEGENTCAQEDWTPVHRRTEHLCTGGLGTCAQGDWTPVHKRTGHLSTGGLCADRRDEVREGVEDGKQRGVCESQHGFPGSSAVKNPPAVQETWVPSLGQEDPLEMGMQPTPLFLPGKSHGERSLAGYSPWGHKLDMA